MKIVDCFIFYNELEMLKYRLELLYDLVDYFVLVESRYTHTGIVKELYYKDNIEMFEKYNDKIIHIVENTAPYMYPNINISENQQWINENYHRNCIKKGLEQLLLKEEDVFIIADLDEIPDPEVLKKVKNNEINVTVNSLEQDLYYYNLNSKLNIKWYHPKILSYKSFKELKLECTEIRMQFYSIIFNGGWHLSYFGDKYFIKNKLNNFVHQEFNTPEFNEVDSIEDKLLKGVDLFNRENITFQRISVNDNTYLPPDYETKLAKYVLF